MQAVSESSTVVTGVITGVLSSLIASMVFIWLVNRIRPSFEISKYMARSIDNDGVVTYRVKFINRTRYRVQNISLNLFRVRSKRAAGNDRTNRLHTVEPIELSKNKVEFMAPYAPRKDKDAFYAARVRILEDIGSSWSEDIYYRLEISGHHSLSGIRWCETMEFANPNICVIDGEFFFGSSMDVDQTKIRPYS